MIYLYATLLILLNLVWLFLTVASLPGNWLMILSAGVLAWYTWADPVPMFSGTILIVVVAVALVGEVLEFVLSAAGAKKAGSTLWGAIGSIVGAVVGAVAGTFVIPIPVIGTILGACGGAFLGALGLELLTGQEIRFSLKAGKGAAIGRFWGTIAKLAVGVAIWLILAIAAFVP